MTGSRRSHQCHKDGCDSEARWRLYVKFKSMTPAGLITPFDCESTIAVCDRHRNDAAEYVVSDRNLTALEKQLASDGFTMPHPSTMQFEFAPVASSALIRVPAEFAHRMA